MFEAFGAHSPEPVKKTEQEEGRQCPASAAAYCNACGLELERQRLTQNRGIRPRDPGAWRECRAVPCRRRSRDRYRRGRSRRSRPGRDDRVCRRSLGFLRIVPAGGDFSVDEKLSPRTRALLSERRIRKVACGPRRRDRVSFAGEPNRIDEEIARAAAARPRPQRFLRRDDSPRRFQEWSPPHAGRGLERSGILLRDRRRPSPCCRQCRRPRCRSILPFGSRMSQKASPPMPFICG